MAGPYFVPVRRRFVTQPSFHLVNQAGQASIEFVLLIVMILLLLHTLVLPHYFLSKQVITDSQQLAQARLGAQQLASAINDVSAGGVGSKRTVQLYMSDKMYLGCLYPTQPDYYPSNGEWGDQRLSFNIALEDPHPPITLPLITTKSETDPLYKQMIANGGGCGVFPATIDGVSKEYLFCFGTIPVNVNCSAINPFASITPGNPPTFVNHPNGSQNDAINICGSSVPFDAFTSSSTTTGCGNRPHSPQVVNVTVVKKDNGTPAGVVEITSAVNGA